MVEKYVSVRAKLDNKVFGKFGITATFISKDSPVYNNRGEEESATETTSTIVIVPYNIIENKQSYQKFGNLDEGDYDGAVRYDSVVKIDDVIVLDGIDYKIKLINKEKLKETVVIILRLTKG